jgi:hypothetical protein
LSSIFFAGTCLPSLFLWGGFYGLSLFYLLPPKLFLIIPCGRPGSMKVGSEFLFKRYL